MSASAILTDSDFDRLMTPLGPFERRPKLALAVSGGADSMALALLAARWVASREGTVQALTVDHGLREEAAAEARQVVDWLAKHGIPHATLRWNGPKPATGLQEAARSARYGLMLERCRRDGILHLLLAHHRNDQAETVLLRMAGGTGPDGLAAIAPVTPTDTARLLRPLLGVPKSILEETLRQRQQPWIEDPSNRNPAFARVRMRQVMPALETAGVTAADLTDLADHARDQRASADEAMADLAARAVMLSPFGFARLDLAALSGAADDTGRRLLDRVLRTVSGSAYPARSDRLDRLWGEVRTGLERRRSLGGCLLTPSRGGLLVHREPAAVAGPVGCRAGETVRWDGRFALRLEGQAGRIGALGCKGWVAVKKEAAILASVGAFPAAVAPTLPALLDEDGTPAVIPHLQWRKRGFDGPLLVDLAFAPTSPLTGGLVWHRCGTMC